MAVNRRTFLKLSGTALAALPFLNGLAPRAGYAADLPEAKETDAQPKALKYCSNPDKSTKTCADRKKAERKDQYCYNCQLFTKASGDGKTAKGKCMLMPANSVPGHAWCMSWVKKP